jgi:hypothetical protein
MVEVQTSNLMLVRDLIDRVRRHVLHGGRILVFVNQPERRPVDIATAVVANIEKIAPQDLSSTRFHFVGGVRKRKLRESATEWTSLYRRRGRVALPVVLPALALNALLVIVNNLRQTLMRRDDSRGVDDCSSFLMTVRV